MSSAADPGDVPSSTSAAEFVLDDFHRVQNPRLMTEDYFDLVGEQYDALAERNSPEQGLARSTVRNVGFDEQQSYVRVATSGV